MPPRRRGRARTPLLRPSLPLPTVAGLRVGRRYAPDTIERLVAAGYAHLRGEAARIDRARGFAYGFTQNRLAHDWRHPEVSRVWRPDPCLPGGRPDGANPNEKR